MTAKDAKGGTHLSSTDPLRDFRNFLYLVWKHLNLSDPTACQYDIATYLQHGPKGLVIEAFRGIGKSWITSAFVVWNLYCDPQMKIMVVSASKQRSDDFSTFTKRLIYEIPQLRFLIPKPDQRQSNVGFDVGPARASHSPSVKSVGITGQLTGSRANLIIADDVEVPNNCATEAAREFLANAVTEFDDVLVPGGRIVYLGTPHTEQSLYNKLEERGFAVRIWPVIYPDEKQRKKYGLKLAPMLAKKLADDPTIEGQPTDPMRFDAATVADRKLRKGLLGFTLQYMLDTSLSDAERYPLKLSDLIVMSLNPRKGPADVIWSADPNSIVNDLPNVGLSGDRFYWPMQIDKDFTEYTGSVMAIDPSGRGGDETAYCIVKMLHGRLFVTAAGGFKGGYSDETLEKLLKVAKAQEVNKIIVEPNFGDGMFAQLLRGVSQKVYKVAIEDAKWSSNQKEARIIDTLEPIMNQHRLVFDHAVIEQDYRSTEHYNVEAQNNYRLMYQLTRLTKDKGAIPKDDRIDALAMAVGYWLDYMSRNTEKAKEAHDNKNLKKELKSLKRSIVMSTSSQIDRGAKPSKRRGRKKGTFMRRSGGISFGK